MANSKIQSSDGLDLMHDVTQTVNAITKINVRKQQLIVCRL